MNQETSTQTRVLNSAFGRPPKGERRVRFADTMGMELVSIFLFELINEYFHNHDSRTRRHQLKLMGHSHNQQQQQLNMNGSSNDQLKLTSNSDSQYYNSSSNNNSYNKSATNTSTTIYQTHNSSSGYNYSSGYHSSGYSNSNNNYSYNNYTQCSPRNTSTTNTATTAAAAAATNNHNNSNNAAASQTSSEPTYICEFTQPISLLSFKERVKLNKVHLETCQINSTAGHVSVSCTIRVLNLSYDKSVIVRYTTDDWRTHTDSLASYKPGTSDGWSDKFTSTFTVTNQVQSFQAGQRIIFAIRCLFDGSDAHWDNNGGLNYAIRRQK